MIFKSTKMKNLNKNLGKSQLYTGEFFGVNNLFKRLLRNAKLQQVSSPMTRSDVKGTKVFSLFTSNLLPSFGFTLSEVIITLGIIGVVAGMTIPNLIANFQKDQTVNQLKSVYTILNNALEQAKVENGTDVNSWYIADDSEASESAYFAQNYLLPYLKTTQVCGSSTSSECLHKVGYLKNLTSATKTYNDISFLGITNRFSFTLVNGAIVQVGVTSITGNSVSNSRVFVNFDINGEKMPNIYGKDAFLVELGGNYGAGNKNKFLPYGLSSSRESLLGSADIGCNKSTGGGHVCFAVIMKDGWKIKDDYPW